MSTDPLDMFVFNGPITNPAMPSHPIGGLVLTKKDLDHASCKVCYRPIQRGDLCEKHEGRQ